MRVDQVLSEVLELVRFDVTDSPEAIQLMLAWKNAGTKIYGKDEVYPPKS